MVSTPPLASGTIHVWHGLLDLDASSLVRLESVLEPDERVRADRFVFRRHRDCFVAARAMLRSVMAHYLRVDAGAVRFSYNEHGKPRLAREQGFRFNLSHSGDRALLAVSCDGEVGADIEVVRPDWSPDDVARRFFSPQECRMLQELPADHRQGAFFRVWTRKEAYIKAHGRGLSMGLDTFDVAVDVRSGNCLVATRPRSLDAAAWWICGLEAPPGFEAALATEAREGPRLEAFTWNVPPGR